MLSFLLDPIVVTVALGAALLGLAAGALGTFAVLRRESLIGDTMSHAALPGVAIGFLLAGERSLPAMLAGAVVTGLAAALFSLYLSSLGRIKRDAAMGVALGLFFAFGVVALSYAQKRPGAAAAGLETFLFGQAAATLRSDLWLLGTVTLVALGVVALLWKQVKAVTFDPDFATNNFVYVYYTATSPTVHNRISRFTASGSAGSGTSATARTSSQCRRTNSTCSSRSGKRITRPSAASARSASSTASSFPGVTTRCRSR